MKSSALLTTAAIILAVTGLALLFAPAESASAMALESSPLFAQLLGASLIGLASANWVARGSSVGGIYGRAVVMANMVTLGVSALVIARAYVNHRTTQLFVLAVIVGALAAGYFALLRSGGPDPGQSATPPS